ncbi:hypothetical protein LOCC1_G008208 [Lachnellula occidentalis]|uniref:Uncharacterized protein n=1 Tax=Lachnellula occidentalis TaxID=215460 RepID=A0A8H8RJ58_9HELO|nr:hypothetical protein LOCC1_G008208 [Lachnellula occidentalis]
MEHPLAYKKTGRQHNSVDNVGNNDYHTPGYRSTKRRRLLEEQEQEEECENSLSITTTPRRDMATRTNPLQELGNHHINQKQTTLQVLEVDDMCNANNTCVREDDRDGDMDGDRDGHGLFCCTAFTDTRIDNKLPSDLMHGPSVCLSKDDLNSKALARNQDKKKDGRYQIPSPNTTIFSSPFYTPRNQRDQGVIPITRPNQQHLLLARTKTKPHTAQNLLRAVLSRPGAPIPLDKFGFLEDEIEFVDILNDECDGELHSRIFRITAGGRSFALKHKYKERDKPHRQYPLPNQDFDHESAVYARTAHLQHLPSSPIPKCYGYVELTKIPQARSRHHRHPFRSSPYWSPAYLDFLIQQDEDIVLENQQWKRYFRDKPPSACILRGIVLEEIPSWTLVNAGLVHQPKLERSGREGLARLHACGMLHGDVGDLNHALIRKSDSQVIWVGFASSRAHWKKGMRDFNTRAAAEIRRWESFFPKTAPTPRKTKPKKERRAA